MAIEDNSADQLLLREVAADTDPALLLTFVATGVQALALLQRLLVQSPAELPHLILLDLGLPGMTGFEVLGVLKGTPGLCRIPVVMLSVSDVPENVTRAYQEQASGFITKPTDYTTFQVAFAASMRFWTQAAFPLPGAAASG
ncbi:response regulator [Deinococcus soli (ex Cha et al. 2016)]|uniref:response regulator n=1 Tax=Deinococcus soli (ex Cha et al. 2016) TaxID=1309411 RepID=UPI001E3B81B7|nr:response regulator [Deinococcus soli (ex Cha et al. 2016)]